VYIYLHAEDSHHPWQPGTVYFLLCLTKYIFWICARRLSCSHLLKVHTNACKTFFFVNFHEQMLKPRQKAEKTVTSWISRSHDMFMTLLAG